MDVKFIILRIPWNEDTSYELKCLKFKPFLWKKDAIPWNQLIDQFTKAHLIYMQWVQKSFSLAVNNIKSNLDDGTQNFKVKMY